LLIVGLALVALIIIFGARAADAASVPGVTSSPAALAQEEEATQQSGGGEDDDLVEVQLLVLGLAAFIVVGVGTVAYLVRKRLGLVAGPPEQGAGGHH
jgi:hypothetical protein